MALIDTARRGALVALALSASACTLMPDRESPLPKSGPTMVDIYRGHASTAASATLSQVPPRDRLPARAVDDDTVSAQRRAVSDPLNARFDRLPNPDLVMLVFPHLASGRYPVPGYQTVFPMWETVQYALPGEVAGRR